MDEQELTLMNLIKNNIPHYHIHVRKPTAITVYPSEFPPHIQLIFVDYDDEVWVLPGDNELGAFQDYYLPPVSELRDEDIIGFMERMKRDIVPDMMTDIAMKTAEHAVEDEEADGTVHYFLTEIVGALEPGATQLAEMVNDPRIPRTIEEISPRLDACWVMQADMRYIFDMFTADDKDYDRTLHIWTIGNGLDVIPYLDAEKPNDDGSSTVKPESKMMRASTVWKYEHPNRERRYVTSLEPSDIEWMFDIGHVTLKGNIRVVGVGQHVLYTEDEAPVHLNYETVTLSVLRVYTGIILVYRLDPSQIKSPAITNWMGGMEEFIGYPYYENISSMGDWSTEIKQRLLHDHEI